MYHENSILEPRQEIQCQAYHIYLTGNFLTKLASHSKWLYFGLLGYPESCQDTKELERDKTCVDPSSERSQDWMRVWFVWIRNAILSFPYSAFLSQFLSGSSIKLPKQGGIVPKWILEKRPTVILQRRSWKWLIALDIVILHYICNNICNNMYAGFMGSPYMFLFFSDLTISLAKALRYLWEWS